MWERQFAVQPDGLRRSAKNVSDIFATRTFAPLPATLPHARRSAEYRGHTFPFFCFPSSSTRISCIRSLPRNVIFFSFHSHHGFDSSLDLRLVSPRLNSKLPSAPLLPRVRSAPFLHHASRMRRGKKMAHLTLVNREPKSTTTAPISSNHSNGVRKGVVSA